MRCAIIPPVLIAKGVAIPPSTGDPIGVIIGDESPLLATVATVTVVTFPTLVANGTSLLATGVIFDRGVLSFPERGESLADNGVLPLLAECASFVELVALRVEEASLRRTW